METGPWNWLEVTKLIAGISTPLVLAGLGIYIHHVTKSFEHLQWRSQKLIEKRLAIYDDLAPHFNDLLCYFTYIGCWKEPNPSDVVFLKRKLDKKIHLAAPLFSKDFHEACKKFQSLCFETHTGWGEDAKLKTQFQRRKEARDSDWQTEWEKCFCSDDKVCAPEEIKDAYAALMKAFAEDIGVHSSASIPSSGRIPNNIR